MRKAFKTAPQLIAILAHKTRSKFSYLFFAQLLLLVLAPYLEKPGVPLLLLRLLAVAALLPAVYAVSDKRAHWMIALVLAVPAGVLNAVSAFLPDQTTVPTLVTTILFLAYTLALLLRAVLRAEIVTLDTIYGALSVYLLIGFVWGVGYMLLEKLHPGALAVGRQPNHQVDWSDCMFYSFVTLTSLGYGDIVPLSPQSRSLSILESVSGTIYIAVLIARLVGLHSATKRLTAGAGSLPTSSVEELPAQTSYPSRLTGADAPEEHSGTHAD